MCIKIVSEIEQKEFDPTEPLECQISNAKEILVNYDPYDSKIPSFIGQIELMVKNGVECKADIKVNANNNLDGIRLERQIEGLKKKLGINEVVKGLCNIHANADKKLSELSKMCLGKMNE